MCWPGLWTDIFDNVTAEDWLRSKLQLPERPGPCGPVASTIVVVIAVSLAICIGMCDGMLDTRGKAVWWIVDVVLLGGIIDDVAHKVVNTCSRYFGGRKKWLEDQAAKAEKLGAEDTVRGHFQKVQIEDVAEFFGATWKEQQRNWAAGKLFQGRVQKVEKDQAAEGMSMDEMKELPIPKEQGRPTTRRRG
jgi:hypothetical protein